ncbi:MAG: ABC transporter ATP-binding protein [Candidatus Caldarchaeum sp.]
MLKAVNITKYFGGLPALDRVSFDVDKGEIFGIIGPNGAGKTTLFNIINGIIRPTSGELILDGVTITNLPPHKRAKIGISRTFQIPRPFLDMSTLDNVALAALSVDKGHSSNLSDARREAYEFLRRFNLHEKAHQPAKSLNLQNKRALELARALMSRARLLLVDEYLSGLNPTEIDNAVKMIRNIRDEEGITILWIDHVMRGVTKLADRVMVLHYGKKLAEGEPALIAKDSKVIQAYLGAVY